MKKLVILSALIGLGLAFTSGTVFAGADDVAWVQKCIKDNKREGQSAATVAIYCTCMNSKMSENETLSITAWEKSHPAEMSECENEAGWK